MGARKPDAAPNPDTQLPLNFSCGGARTHNGFSHQDPGFIDYVCNRKSDVVRVYLPPDEQARTGVTDGYVRLSIGIEHIDDIIADLDQALAAA